MPKSEKPRHKYVPRDRTPTLGAWDQAHAIQRESRNLLNVVPNIGTAIRLKMESGQTFDRPRLTELANLLQRDVAMYTQELDKLDAMLSSKSGDFSDDDDLATALELAMQYSNWNERWAMVVIPTITEILNLSRIDESAVVAVEEGSV
jgi:hypothetical protein